MEQMHCCSCLFRTVPHLVIKLDNSSDSDQQCLAVASPSHF